MSYSVHTLNIENHSHIIGRQDGVTGDTIKANDEIVFCAACQSVFLKDSWNYMKNEHCGQSQTLDFVPSPTPKLIIRKGDKSNDKLIYEVKDEFRHEISRISYHFSKVTKRFFPILFALGLVLLMWYIVPEEYGRSGKESGLPLIFSFVILVIGNLVGVSMKNNIPDKPIEEFSELKILETGLSDNFCGKSLVGIFKMYFLFCSSLYRRSDLNKISIFTCFSAYFNLVRPSVQTKLKLGVTKNKIITKIVR